jgi:hypothetical protein
MLTVLIGGISYPVTLTTDLDANDAPRETIATAAPCPRCTETPPEWFHVVTYDDFAQYKPGSLECQNCDSQVPLIEVK